MQSTWEGVKTGLRRTTPYLLSHHRASERHRCYSPAVAGRSVDLCARCLGVYPGIVLAFAADRWLLASPVPVSLVALLPLPALVDWSATAFTARRGWNPARTATGLLLGFAYGSGLLSLLRARVALVLGVGVCYALAAGALLYLGEGRSGP